MTNRSVGTIALALTAAAMTACSGGTSEGTSQTEGAALSLSAPTPYLALGDSIAFGDDGYISVSAA